MHIGVGTTGQVSAAPLPRSGPGEQGVDAAGIDAFVAAVSSLAEVELHSLMVVRHGHVVAERWWNPYTRTAPHAVYSLSKSFTSTALGLAVAEGRVDPDATVLSYFPEYDAAVTDERSRAVRVRHVAAMASGHEHETIDRAYAAGQGDLLLGFLRIPPDRDPGTVFAYNQPCTFALSAIVQRVSGVTLTSYLRPRLYEPLGITPFGWRTDARGHERGFEGLHVTTEAIAKLGELYLREGEWRGRALLSPAWVATATRAHITTGGAGDWGHGYGLQFWRSRHGYRGDGAFGQFMLVLPEADAVVAITSQSPDMQAVLDAAWAHLLPALTADATADGQWSPPSTSLARPVARGAAGGPITATFEPGLGNELSDLRMVRLRPGELTLADAGPELTVELGAPDVWTGTGPVTSAYAWADGLLCVDLVFLETPHRLHLVLDPAASRFAARFQTEPLERLPLAALRMPPSPAGI